MDKIWKRYILLSINLANWLVFFFDLNYICHDHQLEVINCDVWNTFPKGNLDCIYNYLCILYTAVVENQSL